MNKSTTQPSKLILASTSQTRQAILKHAGINFSAQNSNFDENTYKLENPHLNPGELALSLAAQKALAITKTDALIIGADQTLSFEGQVYDKPVSRYDAHHQLSALRGKTHLLHSAIVITRNDKIIFTTCQIAYLKMRYFSDEFLQNYLSTCSDEILQSVGCYQYENRGIQLFEHIEGDHFTILGFPLLSCLAFLREIKFLET